MIQRIPIVENVKLADVGFSVSMDTPEMLSSMHELTLVQRWTTLIAVYLLDALICAR